MRIPAGCFQMGSPESETGRKSDERQHRVCVEAFEIGQREVTVGEFKRFVAAMNYRTDAERNLVVEGCHSVYPENDSLAGYSWQNPGFAQADNHPVVCVSWNDVMAYTEWLSQRTGRQYRLPTEAEWEYAARAGTTAATYWEGDLSRTCRYANVADQTMKATYPRGAIHDCADGFVYTAPVGSFQANVWNVSDMLGNVWEWTCSKYDRDYNGTETECIMMGGATRSVRPSSWISLPEDMRFAVRVGIFTVVRMNALGFRLAKSL